MFRFHLYQIRSTSLIWLFLALTGSILWANIPASASESCSAPEFKAARRFKVGELLSASAAGDFNGDGHVDLAVVDSAC